MLNREMIVQLPIPSAPHQFDFSKTPAPDIRELVRERAPQDVRNNFERLMDLRVQMIRRAAPAEDFAQWDILVSRVADLEEQIAAFHAQQNQQHLAQLGANRKALREECRLLKDAIDAQALAVATLRNRLNDKIRGVNEWREKLNAVVPPPSYPTPAETQDFQTRQAAVRTELDRATQEREADTLALAGANALLAQQQRDLVSKDEELSAAESALLEFQKK